MRISMLAILAFSLMLCAGCAKGGLSLPGETPVYTVSCDNSLDDCHTGAYLLCNGPYEIEAEPLSHGRKAVPGSFGWVDTAGQQQDVGNSGKYSIRIRCK